MPLPKELTLQIQLLFRRALAGLRSEQDVADFLDDLLTPTEKTMLQKRLAIALLLDKGYDQRAIHRIMKVSVATVNAVNYWLKNQGKGYRIVISRMRKEEQFVAHLEKFDNLLKEFFSLGKSIYPRVPKEVKPKDIL